MLIEEYYLDWEDDVENHPGVKPLHSYLFFGDYFFCIEPEYGRRLGQAKVYWHFEDDKKKWGSIDNYGISLSHAKAEARNKHAEFLEQRRNKVERLNNVLVRSSSSVMDNRFPVVSVGSYAVPSRLRQLYKKDNVSANSVIPVFKALLYGFDVVYANNITEKGAIRTVPVYSTDNTCTYAQVMFMDIQQIKLLQKNDTYKLVEIDTGTKVSEFQGKRLEISDSGEILHHFFVYSCEDQPLSLDATGTNWVAPPSKVIKVDRPQLPKHDEKSQSQLLKDLVDIWSKYYDENKMNVEGYERCRNARALRENLEHKKVNAAFTAFLKATCTGKNPNFEPLNPPDDPIFPSDRHSYAQITTSWAQPPTKGKRTAKTERYVAGDFSIEVPQKGIGDYLYRLRHPYILLKHSSEADATEYSPNLILGKLVASNAIQPEELNIFMNNFLYPHSFLKRNWERLLDKYFPNDAPEQETSAQSKSPSQLEVVSVNMTLRTAIGLEIGEHVECDTPTIPLWYRIREILQDAIIPRRYLITRLQRGEPAAIEIGACLLPAETLQMLGIEPGDYVRLEGIPDEENQWKIPTRRLRAYPIPVDVIEQRATLVRNIEDALFPDCSERLGVFPDLDPIMLDEMARKELNLEICSPVRIRASRRHQATKETRNFLLVVLIALIGLTSAEIKPEYLADIAKFIGGISLVGVLLIWWGLRARLKP